MCPPLYDSRHVRPPLLVFFALRSAPPRREYLIHKEALRYLPSRRNLPRSREERTPPSATDTTLCSCRCAARPAFFPSPRLRERPRGRPRDALRGQDPPEDLPLRGSPQAIRGERRIRPPASALRISSARRRLISLSVTPLCASPSMPPWTKRASATSLFGSCRCELVHSAMIFAKKPLLPRQQDNDIVTLLNNTRSKGKIRPPTYSGKTKKRPCLHGMTAFFCCSVVPLRCSRRPYSAASSVAQRIAAMPVSSQ